MVSYLTTLFLGKPPEAVNQYLVPILSLVSDNLHFLSVEEGFFSRNQLGAG